MVFGVIAPIVAMASSGFLWRRLGRDFPQETIGSLVMTVTGPCLVISSMTGVDVDPVQFSSVAIACVGTVVVSFALSVALISVVPSGNRTYLPMLVFGNTANLGLSVCMFALGDEGLALGSVFYVCLSVLHVVIVTAILSGRAPFKAVLKTPIVYAGLIGGLCAALHWELPEWLGRAVETMGGATIPLMLISLGYTLGGISIRHLGSAVFWSVARMVIGLCSGVVVAAVLDLHGAMAAVVILQASMPPAVLNYLLVMKIDGTREMTANVIFISTAAYILILPVLLMILL